MNKTQTLMALVAGVVILVLGVAFFLPNFSTPRVHQSPIIPHVETIPPRIERYHPEPYYPQPRPRLIPQWPFIDRHHHDPHIRRPDHHRPHHIRPDHHRPHHRPHHIRPHQPRPHHIRPQPRHDHIRPHQPRPHHIRPQPRHNEHHRRDHNNDRSRRDHNEHHRRDHNNHQPRVKPPKPPKPPRQHRHRDDDVWAS